MILDSIYLCAAIIMFAVAFILIIMFQLQIIHLRNQQAHTKECLGSLINLLCGYLAEERNFCQDRLNEITGGMACTSERFRNSRKIEKLDIANNKIWELWQNMN